MIAADKTKLIQHLQCLHGSWLTDFNKNLSIGKCVDSGHCHNIQATNYIDVIYRYLTNEDIDTFVEAAYILEFSEAVSKGINLTLNAYAGGPIIGTYVDSGSPTLATMVANLFADVNTTIGYTAIRPIGYPSNKFILYATGFGTLPSAPILTGDGATMTTTLIPPAEYDVLANEFNCITTDQLDAIICKLIGIFGDCGCN